MCVPVFVSPKVVEHYTSCPRVHALQVVWSDLASEPPPPSFYAVEGLAIVYTPASAAPAAPPLRAAEGRKEAHRQAGQAGLRTSGGGGGSGSSSSGGVQGSGLFPETGEATVVEYEVHDVDSLNNRFRPLRPLETEVRGRPCSCGTLCSGLLCFAYREECRELSV